MARLALCLLCWAFLADLDRAVKSESVVVLMWVRCIEKHMKMEREGFGERHKVLI